MFESDPARQVSLALQHVAAASEQLAAMDPVALSGEELLEALDALEADARRRVGVACALIAELEARGTAGELGYPSAAVLLSERLRIGRREAAARVRLAADLASRRTLSGEQLPAAPPGGRRCPGRRESVGPARRDHLRDHRPAAGPGGRRSARARGPGRADPAQARPCAGSGAAGCGGAPGDRLPGPGWRARDRPRPGQAPRGHAGYVARRVGPAHGDADR